MAGSTRSVRFEHVACRENVDIAWTKFGTERLLGHGETHISSFTATSETEIKDVDVTPGFDYEVRLEGSSLDVLVIIAKRVFEIVTECETGKSVGPYTRYPI